MQTIPETFKNCETIKIKDKCPLCEGKLHHKRVEINDRILNNVKRMGISHKAVNFCSTLTCPFIEQGVIYIKGNNENFLSLEQMDKLFEKFIDKNKDDDV